VVLSVFGAAGGFSSSFESGENGVTENSALLATEESDTIGIAVPDDTLQSSLVLDQGEHPVARVIMKKTTAAKVFKWRSRKTKDS
jgi:hypothetical protein